MRLRYFTKETLISANDLVIANDPDTFSLRQDAITYLPEDIRCPVTAYNVSNDGARVLCRIILGVKPDGKPSAALLDCPRWIFDTLPQIEADRPN